MFKSGLCFIPPPPPPPLSYVCMVMGLFLKPIAEGPKCFQSHVFAHICRILRWYHLVLKFESLLHLQPFLLAPD